MQVVQTHLTRQTANGERHLKTFLPVDPRVKQGSVITLDKDREERWRVEQQYGISESGDIQRGWGLDLPKSQRTER